MQNKHGLSSLPIEIIDKILQNNSYDKKNFAKLAGVCSSWKRLVYKDRHWYNVAFEKGHGYDTRMNVNQLRNFCKSPHSNHVRKLRLEGFIVTSRGHSSSTVLTNSLLNTLGPAMPNLVDLHIFNANIGNVEIKLMPASLKRLNLTGCIIGYEAFAGFHKPKVIPNLEHLDLSYVHNINDEKDSFQMILLRKNLRSLELRHCNKLSHANLKLISSNLTYLTKLNISEMARVDDAVLLEIHKLVRLEQLHIAFTSVTNVGIGYLLGLNQQDTEENQIVLRKLKFLDIRGCFKLTGGILYDIDLYGKSIQQVWIYRTMDEFQAARELLKLQGSPLRIQDEVDLGHFVIGQSKSKYSSHFNDVHDEIIEEVPIEIDFG